MAPFDPYHKWLGIPPEEQPASYYRLLGIANFEFDADVIEGAAEQRTIYLRTFQTGPNSELAERLLNEVSAARVCLLVGKSKDRYDTQLRATLEPSPEDDPLAFTTEELAAVSSKPATRQRSREGKPFWQQPWAIPAAAGGIVVVLLLLMLIFGSGEEPKESGQGQEQELQAEIASLKEKLVAAGNSKVVPTASEVTTKSLPASLQEGLIAYYPFNGNANDESGNGHHGTVHGATASIDRFENPAHAYFFDGVKAFVDLGDRDVFDFGASDFSLSCWFKNNGAQVNKYLLAKYNQPLLPAYGIGTSSDTHSYAFIGDGHVTTTREVAGPANLADSQWHHFAASFDRDRTLSVFVDARISGSIDISKELGDISNSVRLFVGKMNSTYFKGSIDDVRIYNRALSADEVKALYEFESGGTAAATASDKLYLATLRPNYVRAHTFTTNGRRFSRDQTIKVNGIASPNSIFLHPETRSLEGVHAGVLEFGIPAGYEFLVGAVAIDDNVSRSHSPVTFKVSSKSQTVWESEKVQESGRPVGFCIALNSVTELELATICSNPNLAHAVWLDPVLLKSTGGKSLDQIAKEHQARWLKKEE